MRAAVITKPDRPWELREVPDPVAGPGQIVIRIRASGMCGTDLHVHTGLYEVPLPIIAGHEPVGEVVQVGPGVSWLRPGDRVGVSWTQKGCGRCRSCRADRPIYCPEEQTWVRLGGGNAALMPAWADGCTLLPEGLAWEEAAPVFCAGYTVTSGLRSASPRPGERVAVLGVGGLGHMAIQVAAALGLEVVAVTSHPGKAGDARRLGASEVIPAGTHAGEALSAAGGADVILSTTNDARAVGQALHGLRPEGRLVNMGILDRPIEVDANHLLSNQLRLIGSIMNHRRDLVEALDLVAAGRVKPMIEVFDFERINEARERLQAGRVRYRAVIAMPDRP